MYLKLPPVTYHYLEKSRNKLYSIYYMSKGYFMKMLNLLFILSMFAAMASPAWSQSSGLDCSARICVFGDISFCRTEDYTDIAIKNFESDTPVWNGELGQRLSNNVDDKVQLDFSAGDQYAIFTFRKDDLAALKRDPSKTLLGTFEDGYTWADGYHTRALLSISCLQRDAL